MVVIPLGASRHKAPRRARHRPDVINRREVDLVRSGG